ncbi:hypothetical protein P6F26_05965 [Roseibacterium sp. SDUM158017]|uniref:hypothetical protein n=1 Tax=Roseicyclus salinarum TaxID=3036773 RepID=UPI0024154410|nr:hypothetical protein [Roseibacterium sp. SDUM158017]MDG4647983.1 hypothetical protein [Roseibacterium sp. SDUM158017]
MTRRIAGLALLVILAQFPAHAWQAGVEGRLCTLEHSGEAGEVRLTYDPALPLYTIALTRDAPWPEAAFFEIRFIGAASGTISTTRHVLSDGGRTLTVTDRGFGNVLDGLEFNSAAVAVAGVSQAAFDLAGAAPEVAAFRACLTAPAA